MFFVSSCYYLWFSLLSISIRLGASRGSPFHQAASTSLFPTRNSHFLFPRYARFRGQCPLMYFPFDVHTYTTGFSYVASPFVFLFLITSPLLIWSPFPVPPGQRFFWVFRDVSYFSSVFKKKREDRGKLGRGAVGKELLLLLRAMWALF